MTGSAIGVAARQANDPTASEAIAIQDNPLLNSCILSQPTKLPQFWHGFSGQSVSGRSPLA
ncbi:MAG TPA: hypothetical protein V6C63_17475 [Allocoleopsis sp.]